MMRNSMFLAGVAGTVFSPVASKVLVKINSALLSVDFFNGNRAFREVVVVFRISATLLGILVSSLALPVAYGQALEEIIVTAERRETNLQNTPVALSVITELELERAETRHLSDLINLTAGLSFEASNPDQARIGLRGLITREDSAGTDQSTGLFVDGLYFGRTALLNQNLFDVERVEVLRGPQGTLWGHNVVAGSINVITRDPTDELEVEARLTTGNHGRLDFSGRVAGPISENLLGQISVASENTDGYIRNVSTGNDLEQKDFFSTRGKLIWTPTEGAEIKLSVGYQENNSYGHALTLIGASQSALSPVVPLPSHQDSPGEIDQFHDGTYDTDLQTLNLTGQWDLGNELTVTSQTGYINFDADNHNNSFFTFPAEIGQMDRDVFLDDESFSQELRIANDPSNRLIWQAGIFLYDNSSRKQEDWLRTTSFRYPTFACIALRVCRAPQYNTLRQLVESNTSAIFGQATYAVSENVNLTFGGRYTTVEKTSFNHVEGDHSRVFLQDGPPSCFPGNPEFMFRSCGFMSEHTSNWDDFTPKFTADFPLEEVGGFDAVMPYVTVSRGWKAGGYDPGTTAAEAVIPFLPEEAWNYEFGIKTTFLDNRVNFNATFFHTNYENLQIISVQATGPGIITENADSEIDGVELDILASLTDWLDVSAGFTNYDSHYKEGSTSGGNPIGGNETASTPKNTWNIGWNMGRSLGNDMFLSFGGNYSYKDAVFFNPQNHTFRAFPEAREFSERSILNANLSLAWDNWELTVWGRNLLDDAYVASATGFGGFYTSHIADGGRLAGWPTNATAQGNLQEPLNYGVSVKWSY